MFQPPLGRCWNTWKTWALQRRLRSAPATVPRPWNCGLNAAGECVSDARQAGMWKSMWLPSLVPRQSDNWRQQQKWTKIQLVIKQKKGILGKRGQQSTRKAPDCLNGTHSAVMCRWTLPLIVPDTLAGCFPPMLDTNRAQNEKEPPPAAPRRSFDRNMCTLLRGSLDFRMGSFIHLCVRRESRREGERERGREGDIVYLVCHQNKSPVGIFFIYFFWSQDTLNANDFILSGALL